MTLLLGVVKQCAQPILLANYKTHGLTNMISPYKLIIRLEKVFWNYIQLEILNHIR
jgi:hypothetical protein